RPRDGTGGRAAGRQSPRRPRRIRRTRRRPSASRAQQLLEGRIAVTSRDVELRPGALLRLLVRAEAHEARAVTEALSFELVEADLADELRPDLVPGEILSA